MSQTNNAKQVSVALKARIQPYRIALADFEATAVNKIIADLFTPDAVIKLCHPFGTLTGPDALMQKCQLSSKTDPGLLSKTAPPARFNFSNFSCSA